MYGQALLSTVWPLWPNLTVIVAVHGSSSGLVSRPATVRCGRSVPDLPSLPAHVSVPMIGPATDGVGLWYSHRFGQSWPNLTGNRCLPPSAAPGRNRRPGSSNRRDCCPQSLLQSRTVETTVLDGHAGVGTTPAYRRRRRRNNACSHEHAIGVETTPMAYGTTGVGTTPVVRRRQASKQRLSLSNRWVSKQHPAPTSPVGVETTPTSQHSPGGVETTPPGSPGQTVETTVCPAGLQGTLRGSTPASTL